jgi:hypothetical protein
LLNSKQENHSLNFLANKSHRLFPTQVWTIEPAKTSDTILKQHHQQKKMAIPNKSPHISSEGQGYHFHCFIRIKTTGNDRSFLWTTTAGRIWERGTKASPRRPRRYWPLPANQT